MRLPEKTIELNFCAELTAHWAGQGQSVLWFGPTQRQEAKLGFDAATKLSGGRLYLFQFKASRQVLPSGCRRFKAPHRQMEILHGISARRVGSVFYVFPTIGTTHDLTQSPSVLANSLLMDVAALASPLPLPIGRNGQRRVDDNHLVDVDAGKRVATIHSDPFEMSLISAWNFPIWNPSIRKFRGTARRWRCFLSYANGSRGGPKVSAGSLNVHWCSRTRTEVK